MMDSEGLVPGVKPSRDAVSIDQKIDGWQDVLDQLGDDFREGRAAVDPKDRRKSCQYCALPTLCRINEAQRAWMLAGSTRMPDRIQDQEQRRRALDHSQSLSCRRRRVRERPSS